MTISKDLFLALLSMDAYNREYGAGLEVPGSSIGYADILTRTSLNISKEDYDAWQAAGFYAVAYKTTKDIGTAETGGIIPAGTTIISYRGTDNFTNDPIAGGTDILNGWVAGAGTTIMSSQPSPRARGEGRVRGAA